jgi:hypothetical protein
MANGPGVGVEEKGIDYAIANGRRPSRYENRSIGQFAAAQAGLDAAGRFRQAGNFASALGRAAGK